VSPKQAVPELDVLYGIEVTEVVQAHCKSVWMIDIEKGNLSL